LDCWLDFSTARWLQPQTPEIAMQWSEKRQKQLAFKLSGDNLRVIEQTW
jgi:hypothetical protein